VLGWTETTNSIVWCTPLGRHGIIAKAWMRWGRSHGCTRPGWTSVVREGIKFNVPVLHDSSVTSSKLDSEYIVKKKLTYLSSNWRNLATFSTLVSWGSSGL
jgi:hypothetical protein